MQVPLTRSIRRLSRTGLVLLCWCVAVWAFHQALGEGGFGWSRGKAWAGAFLLAFGSSWAGWAVRQAWIHPRRLKRAEALWAAGGFASDVVDLLAGVNLATGELGHRVWLLRSRANLALGYRNLAWAESEEAHLARVPFWLRGLLRLYLRSIPDRSEAFLDRTGPLWMRLVPNMPSLQWRLAIHHLRRGRSGSREKAWELLLAAMPYATEDPALLEDLMLALLGRLQERDQEAERLGPQTGMPEFQAAFERALDLLLHRHGYPRTGWDRVAPAMHLLQRGRYDEVLAISRTLPLDRSPEALWVATVAAQKGLGDLNGAWNSVEQALAQEPGSFRLWMMREDLALDLRKHPEALESLERAWTLFQDGGPMEQLREWHTRRAEYAYWIEEDPDEAGKHLDFLPATLDPRGQPPLRLFVLLDLGRYDEAHREVAPLLAEHPGNLDLLLIQAESLGGMEAWDSLRELLDTLGQEARERAEFWHLRGLCRSHQDDLLAAREDLERCARMEPDNLDYMLDAGHACADLGEWERAEFYWRQALRLDERSEEAFIELADTRRNLHDPEGARRLLRECLLLHPESGSAQIMLAELEAN